MIRFQDLLRRYEYGLFVLLFVVASSFLFWDVNRQLVDYDEATYAKVVMDTLQSGNFTTLQLHGQNWFEKPPLYFWLAMGSVKVFGESEFAFRLPSLLASILCCFLVYCIIRELTGNRAAAALGFLVLLFSNSFFVFAREARLDSAVTAAILAALFFYIRGWKNEKYLLWVFPCIAIGFLFKSVIALLAIPIILIYSLVYSRWRYVSSNYMWCGLGIAILLVVPWHLAESLQFGHLFWDSYITQHVLHRAITTVTGTSSYTDYLILFIPWYLPWNGVLILEILALTVMSRLQQFDWRLVFRQVMAPLAVALFIGTTFTLARTHLAPYIMPAFPFFALGIAVTYHHLSVLFFKHSRVSVLLELIMMFALFAGAVFCIHLSPSKVPPYTFDERAIGTLYKEHNTNNAPLYVLDWLAIETLNYYGNTRAQSINPAVVRGTTLHGPFYLVVQPPGATYFFYSNTEPIDPGIKLIYAGTHFLLIYSDNDLQMPMFQYVPRL